MAIGMDCGTTIWFKDGKSGIATIGAIGNKKVVGRKVEIGADTLSTSGAVGIEMVGGKTERIGAELVKLTFIGSKDIALGKVAFGGV